ncbi:MAG: sigma-70 family RNA polymerase sigma factor [Anaerolineae bacterium]|nr:sigma-70 family RNA polymerase sigma factor [Anaerolineae bacterium]
MLKLFTKETAPAKTDAPSPELDFADLFRSYYRRMYNYLSYRVGAKDDVEDLISVVFEKAYVHRDQYDSTKGAFSTWLFRIARNTLANYYRTRQRRSAWEADSEIPDDFASGEAQPETQIIRREDIIKLLHGVEQLNERDQEIISLKFAGRLNNDEIGTIMDMTANNVGVVLYRALRRLQKQLQENAS